MVSLKYILITLNMLCQILELRTTYLIDWSARWRLQREQRESRDPAGSVANEEARPRPRNASTWNGNQEYFFILSFPWI